MANNSMTFSMTFTLSGDANSAVAALEKFNQAVKASGENATASNAKLGAVEQGIKQTGESAGNARGLFSTLFDAIDKGDMSMGGMTASLGTLAAGFGGFGALGVKATDLVVQGITAMANEIPEAIHATDNLVEQYKQLHITAGMSIADFNAFNTTLELSGSNTEELTSIVGGWQKALKKNSENLVENGVAANETALKHMTLKEYISAVVDVMEKYSNATDKDQLLMAAFSKSGMAFANTLKEINENYAEGLELSEKNKSITQQLVIAQEEREKAIGREKNALDALNRAQTEYYGGWDKAWTELHTKWLQWRTERAQDRNVVQEAIDRHIINAEDAKENWAEALTTANAYFSQLATKIAAVNAEIAGSLKQMNQLEMMRTGTHTVTDSKGKVIQQGQAAVGESTYKPPKEKKEKTPKEPEVDPYKSYMNQLLSEAVQLQEQITIEEKNTAEIEAARIKYNEELNKINQQMAKKGNTMTDEEADKLRAQAYSNYVDAVVKSDSEASTKRANIAKELQDKLTKYTEEGEGDRYYKVEDDFKKIWALYYKTGEIDKTLELTIGDDKKAALAHASAEIVKKDLSELKKELSDLAEAAGGSLVTDEIAAKLKQFADQSKWAAEAVKQYKISVHWDETAAQGALAGLRQFVAQTETYYSRMRELTLSLANSVTNALGTMFQNILTRSQTPLKAVATLFKSLAQSVIQSLSQMAARQMVNWAVEKNFAAWKTMAANKEKAQDVAGATTKQTTEAAKAAAVSTSLGQQTAAVTSAAAAQSAAMVTASTTTVTSMMEMLSAYLDAADAATWAAYAGIPFVGEGLALAQIALINSTMTAAMAANKAMAIPGMAIGGYVDQPTLALIGEAGAEIVAPASSFNDWANAHQNLGYNVAAHDAQVGKLQAQATSYGTTAISQGLPTYSQYVLSGNIFASTKEGKRALVNMMEDVNYTKGRTRG